MNYRTRARSDWQIIEAILADSRFLVGDVDQSIFSFRKGDPFYLMEACKTADVFTLTCNYRSDVAICTAANELIAHNQNRLPKLLVPNTTGAGDDPRLSSNPPMRATNCMALGRSYRPCRRRLRFPRWRSLGAHARNRETISGGIARVGYPGSNRTQSRCRLTGPI